MLRAPGSPSAGSRRRAPRRPSSPAWSRPAWSRSGIGPAAGSSRWRRWVPTSLASAWSRPGTARSIAGRGTRPRSGPGESAARPACGPRRTTSCCSRYPTGVATATAIGIGIGRTGGPDRTAHRSRGSCSGATGSGPGTSGIGSGSASRTGAGAVRRSRGSGGTRRPWRSRPAGPAVSACGPGPGSRTVQRAAAGRSRRPPIACAATAGGWTATSTGGSGARPCGRSRGRGERRDD